MLLMKNNIYLICFSLFSIISCNKSNPTYSNLASVNIVNGMVNSSPILPSFGTTKNYSQAENIYFGGYYDYALNPGNNVITIVQGTDTSQTVFTGTLSLSPNSIYSLFLTGMNNTADTILTHDQLPQHSGLDSVIGLRFINCSPGSNPFSINLQGSMTNLVNSLGYKQITTFQTIPGSGYNPSFTLEVRDAVSDSLLTTFNGSGVLYKNQTIVISGIDSANAAVPLTVFAVNHY
jgi:hypothetical protein